jgi:hypothetical protein
MENKIDDKTADLYLAQLLNWTKYKIQEMTQPPWAQYRYMQLSEVASVILESKKHTKIYNCPPLKGTDHLQVLGRQKGKHLRLVDDKGVSQDKLQPPQSVISVNLPM